MKTKRIFSYILTLFLFINALAMPALANEIMPCWENIFCVQIAHGPDNGNAGCYIYIDAYDGTNKIDNIDINFYQIVGNTLVLIAHWDDLSVMSDEFTFYEEVDDVATGHTYRLAITADVHRYGYVEQLDTYNDVAY